jgi:hypothetical protein
MGRDWAQKVEKRSRGRPRSVQQQVVSETAPSSLPAFDTYYTYPPREKLGEGQTWMVSDDESQQETSIAPDPFIILIEPSTVIKPREGGY